MSQRLAKILVSLPNVINYDPVNMFEYEPGLFAPIYMNVRAVLASSIARQIITNSFLELLSKKQSSDFEAICGIESGASYYASILSDKLSKPLSLVRKFDKNYGVKGRTVGFSPSENSKLLFVDDVLATGFTLSSTIKFVKPDLGNSLLISIFSYGYDVQIEKMTGLKILSLVYFEEVCTEAQNAGVFSRDDVQFLLEHVKEYVNILPNNR